MLLKQTIERRNKVNLETQKSLPSQFFCGLVSGARIRLNLTRAYCLLFCLLPHSLLTVVYILKECWIIAYLLRLLDLFRHYWLLGLMQPLQIFAGIVGVLGLQMYYPHLDVAPQQSGFVVEPPSSCVGGALSRDPRSLNMHFISVTTLIMGVLVCAIDFFVHLSSIAVRAVRGFCLTRRAVANEAGRAVRPQQFADVDMVNVENEQENPNLVYPETRSMDNMEAGRAVRGFCLTRRAVANEAGRAVRSQQFADVDMVNVENEQENPNLVYPETRSMDNMEAGVVPDIIYEPAIFGP